MDVFIGTILPVPFIKVPVGWHLCDGTPLPISGNEMLFSLIGTTYGGDGRTNFNLPDLRNRFPLGTGILSTIGTVNTRLGDTGGRSSTEITAANLPPHTHALTSTQATGTYSVASAVADATDPTGAVLGDTTAGKIYATTAANTQLASATMTATATLKQVGYTPDDQTLSTLPAYSTINFIICLQGLYPSQN